MMDETARPAFALTADLQAEWARELARVPETSERRAGRNLFLFRLGVEWFAIDPKVLAATMPDARPRRLPHRREAAVEGLVVFDGRVIICLALDRFFELLAPQQTAGLRRLLVLSWQDWTFALRADEVAGVEELPSTYSAPSKSSSEHLKRCTSGVVLHRGLAVTCLEAEPFMKELEAMLQ